VEPIVYTVPHAGKLLGLNRNSSYEAARRGYIPVITVGRRLLVSRRAFHEKFGT
jgi:hypothetical protein